MRIGIVGNGTDKFTVVSREKAKETIRDVLVRSGATVVVSGHSPVGGVDIWAEEVAHSLNIPTDIKAPEEHSWGGNYGYKARNLDIAKDSDVVHVIVARTYPPDYRGRRFSLCYHCKSNDHVKSGACWTARQAIRMGKAAVWHVIEQDG